MLRNSGVDMTRKQFRFWVNDEKLQAYLDGKTSDYGEFSNFARETFTLMMLNKLDPRSYDDLKKQKLKIDIIWRQAQIAHINSKLDKPIPTTPEAETAHYAPEENNLDNLINVGWNRYVNTIRSYKEGWTVTCKLCPTGFPQIPTKELAIERFKTHLQETHAEELVRTV